MSDVSPKGRIRVEEIDVERLCRRKRIVMSVVMAGSIAVLAGGAYFAWLLTPPALPTTSEEAIAVAKSPRFQRLSKEAKQPYYDVIREQFGMDRELRQVWREDEELRDAARDMFRQQMEAFSKAWMLAGPEQRAAMTAEMPWGGRGGGEGRPPRGDNADGGGDRPRDGGEMRNRMSDRIANGSAQGAAAMGEMIQARRQQREQQGN